MRHSTGSATWWSMAGGAFAMDSGIWALYFIGMEAAYFQPGSVCLMADAGIRQDLLAAMVTVTAMLLPTIATLIPVA